MNPQVKQEGSNPTPRVIFVGSTVSFMTRKRPTLYIVLVKKDDNSRYADYPSN